MVERRVGVPAGCVRSASPCGGSSSHLPPYFSQPKHYPQPRRPAVSSPSKRGLLLWGDVAEGWGAPPRDPLTWSPAPAGQTAQTDSTVSAPCRLPRLSFISHWDPRGWWRDRGDGGERGLANEHNEETDTDHPDLPTPTPPRSIHLWVQISLFPMDKLLPSPPPSPFNLCTTQSPVSSPALCGQARPYWPHDTLSGC